MTTVTKTRLLSKPMLGQLVDQNHLEMARTIYRETRWEFHSKRLGRNDSLSAWFTLDIVKEFIQKSKVIGANAVKIYFGIYPENFIQRSEFSGLQTLVLVAAREKGGAAKDLYYTNDQGKSTTMSLNMPAICPPYCGGATTKVEGTPYDQDVKIYTAGAFVDQDYVEMLKANYRAQRHSYNSEIIGKTDSLSATFAMDIFEKFVADIESQRAIGIKFYFGAYPDYYEEMPEYSSMQTIIAVGIRKTKTSEGFVLKDMVKMSLNMASLCPPFCQGTTKVEGTPYDEEVSDIN